MPMQEDPLIHVCNEIEDKTEQIGDQKAALKYLPLHFMPKRERSSGCTAMLRYAASTSNFAINEDNLIDLNALHGKLLGANAIVYTVATRGGQINIETPLPWLTSFRYDPTAANV